MLRAVQTASAVGQCLNLHPIGLEMLHESGGVFLGDDTLGEVEPALGKSVEYFQSEYPEMVIPKDLNSEGWWGKRPYEVLAQRQERAGNLLSFLLEQHGRTSDRIALISHGDFLNVFLSKVVGFPTSDGIWFSSHNTGITRIDFRERRRRIVYQNRTSHLPPSLLTA
jgi:broad specificity phosphatase PhoE